jgi:outer membrane receptor protein involved in Fe transport
VQAWFNTTAFVLPGEGRFGDAGRNTIEGPGQVTFNMALSKTIQFKEPRSLELRAQASNIFNKVQFVSIDTVVNSPTYGQVISAGAMRRMQLSARYRF